MLLEKEIDKLHHILELVQDTENVIEIKTYVYEAYNSVPADLQTIYETIFDAHHEKSEIAPLKKAIDEVSNKLEEFWNIVNV